MIKFPFKLTSKKCLGIDIGISSIKVVELSRGRKNILENYGEIETKFLYQRSLGTLGETPLLLSSQAIARAILSVLEAAEIKTKKAIFSIPDFSSFFTNFVLPPMAKEEIPEAVRFEARQHIPLPLSAVTLDWQIIQRGVAKEEKGVKILLVAVSNEIIHQYRKIAEYANLELLALEAEVFGLLRSSVSVEDEKKVISIVDIGARSTTCSIIDSKNLKVSHSFDISGNQLTEILAKSLVIDYKTAEEIKQKYGIVPCPEFSKEDPLRVRKILLPLIDLIGAEIENTAQNFYQKEGKKIEKLILAGGTALLPGLKEHLSETLSLKIEIADPFSKLSSNPALSQTLKKMGPSYAIAVGMALREFD